MKKILLLSGLICGFIAIILGAFGTHYLEERIDINTMNSFQTATTYQMYHALFLLLLSIIKLPNPKKQTTYLFTIIGVCLFSGIIYLHTALELLNYSGLGILNMLIPIGGLSLMIAWAYLIVSIIKDYSSKKPIS